MSPFLVTHSMEENSTVEEYATDKDLSTISTATPGADGADGVWFRVELDKYQFVHKIILHQIFFTDFFHPDEACVASEEAYQACLAESGGVEVSVYKGEEQKGSCGTLELGTGLEQADQVYTLACLVYGDAVKLSKADGKIRVLEIVVVGRCKTK